jgi:type IV pilus assembly protein PilM
VQDIIALPVDQAVLDFIPVGEPDLEAETVTGLLIAAPRRPLSAAVQVVERAGLRVGRVDLSSFAALRSCAGAHLNIEAVVDMGAHLTNVVIHEYGIPRVIRTVARGGEALTAHLASRSGLDLADAETAKRAVGLTGDDPDVSEALTEGLRPLFAEIRSSLHLFASANPSGPLERVTLTGGAASLPGLAPALATQLGVRVDVGTPMRHVTKRRRAGERPGDERFASAVSVGLAMGVAA